MACRLSSARGLAILPELETPRLTLRRLQFDDAPFLVELLNEPSFIENIGDRGVRSIEDAHRYLREGPMAMYEKLRLRPVARGAQVDGAAVGMCGLLKRDNLPDVDVGYAFLPQFWGQGYALRGGRGHAAPRRAEIRPARACIGVVSEGNAGSIRVLEKLGMTLRAHVHRDATPDEPRGRGSTAA